VWQLSPDVTFGAGRAPSGVDVALPVQETDGRQDESVPRLAVRLQHRGGLWWITNHSSGAATVTLSAPGGQEELSASSPPHAVRRRRLTATVRARDTGPDGPSAVEHRLTLMLPWIRDDLPRAIVAGGDPSGGITEMTEPPQWTWAHRRLLAAWAYPDLIGLAARGQARNRTARLLLRQSPVGEDPNERILGNLRRKAGRELGVPLAGEAGTPTFLAYVVSRRGYLGEALAALHAEYDTAHPTTSS